MLEKCILVRFSKRTGKIDTTMEGWGNAMMRLWALQNTTPTKECLIFTKESGQILYRVVGIKNGFPRVDDSTDGALGFIQDYCPGLLEVIV